MGAYSDGQKAYWDCKSFTSNPHAKGTKEHSEWACGFSDEQIADNEFEDDYDNDFADEDWDDDETTLYY